MKGYEKAASSYQLCGGKERKGALILSALSQQPHVAPPPQLKREALVINGLLAVGMHTESTTGKHQLKVQFEGFYFV